MTGAKEIVRFWLEDIGEAGWYAAVDAVDATIRDRFGALWTQARDGGLADWCDTPQGALAYLILTDQFPRNMFRGDARAFATDAAAREAARGAIDRGLDLEVAEPERVFFYMPFEHSEDLADQDLSVDLTERNLPLTGKGYALHARAHREVIRRFGRFPFRNAALGRDTTPEERAFLDGGGYGAVVRGLGG